MDRDMYKLELDNHGVVLPVIWEVGGKLELEQGIKVRHMRKKDLQAEVERFLEIYNIAWSKNWGFAPIRREEMEHTAKEMMPILDEDWMMVCETADGETVGMALSIADVNQVLRRMN